MAADRLDEYKEVIEKIEVPKELKAKTIAKMKAQKQIKKKTQVPYAAVAALAILVAGGAYLTSGNTGHGEIQLAQSLEADTVMQEVALTDGTLYFEELPGEFKNKGFQLGVLEGEEVVVDEAAYFKYLDNENPLPDYLPKGFTKQENTAQTLRVNEDGTYVSDYFTINYTDGEEGSLELVLSKHEIPDEDESKELRESKVLDTTMKLSYSGKEESAVFTAYFMANGVGYKVKGKSVTQEEFIKMILSII